LVREQPQKRPQKCLKNIASKRMQPLKIQIKIQPGRPLKVDVLNGQGTACQLLTQPLEKLGAAETTHKPEYYEEQSINLTNDVQLGGSW
jgi:hypothetical protein